MSLDSAGTFRWYDKNLVKTHESTDPSCLVSTVEAGGGGAVMVWRIFSWHSFFPLSTNYASFQSHSLSEYCCSPCTSLSDHSVPIYHLMAASSRIMHHVWKLTSCLNYCICGPIVLMCAIWARNSNMSNLFAQLNIFVLNKFFLFPKRIDLSLHKCIAVCRDISSWIYLFINFQNRMAKEIKQQWSAPPIKHAANNSLKRKSTKGRKTIAIITRVWFIWII